MPLEEAGKFLTRSGGGPSFTDWKWVQAFFGEGGSVGIESLKPSNLEYHEAQRGAYSATLEAEKESLRSTDQSLRHHAYQESRPTLRRGEIDELEFIENAELVSLEAAVSALSSFVGQSLNPVPVLGAVIGNTVGIVMYTAVSTSLSKREAALIELHLDEQRVLDAQLAAEYQGLIVQLEASMSDYLVVLERAFAPEVEVALLGSVELALELGVASEEVLDSEEKVLTYFPD